MSGKPAVFYADVGVIVEDRSSVSSPADVRWSPDAIPLLRRMAAEFELILLAPPPSGSSRTTREGGARHVRLLREMNAAGIPVRAPETAIQVHEEACCRAEWYARRVSEAAGVLGLDLNASFVVSSRPEDVQPIAGLGAFGICIRSGHRERLRNQRLLNAINLPDLRAAADWMLGEVELRRRIGDVESATRAAADCLRAGGVVAFPTETVYGLGANAFDKRAVARIFEIKRRPRFDPLIVHVEDVQAARELVESLPEVAALLMDRFWPGPLTLVLPKQPCVPDLVTAGWPTVALRSPRHPVAWRLLRNTGFPIAAPSANRFGCVSPTTAKAVSEQLSDDMDMLLDGGPCPVGVESTIVAIEEGGGLTLLRPGGLPVEEIEALIGPIVRSDSHDDRPRAPGRLLRHYAPRTPLRLFKTRPPPNPRAGFLAFRTSPPLDAFGAVEVLSTAGDLREAAARLFEAIRRLDAGGLDILYAETVPETGLGLAINDRLRRASEREGGER